MVELVDFKMPFSDQSLDEQIGQAGGISNFLAIERWRTSPVS